MTDRIPREGEWPQPDAPGIYVMTDSESRGEYVCGSIHVNKHLENLAFALTTGDEQRAPRQLLAAWRRGVRFTARVAELCEERDIVRRKGHYLVCFRPYWNYASAVEGDAARHVSRTWLRSSSPGLPEQPRAPATDHLPAPPAAPPPPRPRPMWQMTPEEKQRHDEAMRKQWEAIERSREADQRTGRCWPIGEYPR